MKLRSETDCLNCGAEVKGHYCSECGQPNYLPKESFRHILTHFITDYLHLDEKFFSSLKFLLFNPGLLTIAYNEGKRVKYVHPFRLYIFITIVFFIVQSFDSKNQKTQKNDDAFQIDPTGINITDSLNFKDTADEGGIEVEQGIELPSDTTIEQYLARQDSLPEAEKDGMLKRYFSKKTILAEQNNFDLSKKITETFKKNIPKMMFLILPIFALILSLFFKKKKLYYVEHFYHSVYLHSFFYLYMLIFAFIAFILPENLKTYINGALFIGIVVYFYKSLIKVYEENAIFTLLKVFFILILYFIALMILVVLNALFSFLIL